jgi:hypothetical protein
MSIKTTEVYFKNKSDLARSGGPLTVNGISAGFGVCIIKYLACSQKLKGTNVHT